MESSGTVSPETGTSCQVSDTLEIYSHLPPLPYIPKPFSPLTSAAAQEWEQQKAADVAWKQEALRKQKEKELRQKERARRREERKKRWMEEQQRRQLEQQQLMQMQAMQMQAIQMQAVQMQAVQMQLSTILDHEGWQNSNDIQNFDCNQTNFEYEPIEPAPFSDHSSEADTDSGMESDESTVSHSSSVGKMRQPPDAVDVIEKLMKLVALERVKEQFLAIKSKVEICHKQKASLKKERFHAVFQGNPGTGMYNPALIYSVRILTCGYEL